MIPPALDQLLTRGVLPHATLLLGGDPGTYPELARELQGRLGIAPADAFHLTEPPAVDELRRVLGRVHLKPNQSASTGVFLLGLDHWSPEAANTLLKTLEEPPAHALLVLFARDESAVLPTIRSRAATYRLPAGQAGLAGAPMVDPDLPTLATLADQPLSEACTTLMTLSESTSVATLLGHWVATTPDPFRARLLKRLTALGTRPVNRRLALESLLVEYRVHRAERTA
ncbi:hypothetical protein HY374_02825 [Candidatus Berkelbacteria bacterium]|nr:hypothetical protein [Candidatus Berkelbacteria bacterium]